MEKETARVNVAAGVVIKKEGKYLLVQEKQPRVYGLWNFPAGRVDVGETFEQTAVREALEECGYQVDLVKKIGIFQATPTEAVKHAFEARIIGGKLHFPEEEILDAQWFTFEEIVNMRDKLRASWVIDASALLEEPKAHIEEN